MVSLRRRRTLGLWSEEDIFAVESITSTENDGVVENDKQTIKLSSAHSLPSDDVGHQNQGQGNKSEDCSGPSNVLVSSSSKEEPNYHFPVKEIKRRKQHRRKHYVDQEPCIMRGVYFKNMKWQAAIKVDKKQIHLGTVGSQEEAARLYDRAAFMCGREPNFELSEEEKRELSQYKWEEFLAMTRSAITNKKQQKRLIGVRQNDWENELGTGGSSVSDDGDADISAP